MTRLIRGNAHPWALAPDQPGHGSAAVPSGQPGRQFQRPAHCRRRYEGDADGQVDIDLVTVEIVGLAPQGDQVASVRTLGLTDGEQIAMNRNETPTRGRALTVLEQLLGNVGRGQQPRTDEDTPGQRRPD